MKTLIVLSLITLTSTVFGAEVTYKSKQDYVKDWYSTAVRQMITHKIPASITLAQGVLESSFGNSDLAKYANNHFGIKCHEWTGERIYKDDDKKNECFRKYVTAAQSYEDHSQFLTTRSRYAKLFTLEITDYKAWAQGLKEAGYATNPKYPELLVQVIEDLKLYEYDKLGLTNFKNIDLAEVGNKNEEASSPKAPVSTPAVKTSDKHKAATPVKTKTAGGKEKEEVVIEVQNTSLNKKATPVMSPLKRTDRAVKVQANKVKFIVAKKGDTFYKIAREFELTLSQLYRYNDFPKGKDILTEGDIVYLQPKRAASRKLKSVTLEKDMAVIDISQAYGVKTSEIVRKNKLESASSVIAKGKKVKL